MNQNELYFVKEFKFDNPLITKKDSILDSCFTDCHNKYFHKFKYEKINDIKLTNINDNEIFNLTNVGKNMNLYE